MGLIIIDRIILFFLGLMIFFVPISNAVIEISACICIVAWIIKKILILKSQKNYHFLGRLSHFFINTSGINRTLILFIFANFLGAAFSSNIGISFDAFFSKLSEYTLLFIIVRDTVNTRLRFRMIVYVILASLSFMCLDGTFQFITGHDFFRNRELFIGRITASYINPNNLGSYLITLIPLVLTLLFVKFNKKIKILLTMLFIAGLLILMLTLSRGAILAFIPALLFFGLYTKKRFTLFILLGIFIVGLVLPAFYSSSLPNLTERLFNFSDAGAVDRMFLWKAAIRMFMHNPIFGVGLGTFMKNYSLYWIQPTTEISYAHNCYLQTLAETGIIGFTSFILFLSFWFWKTLKVLSISKKSLYNLQDSFVYFSFLGLSVGLVAYLVNSFVDTNFYSLSLAVLFWFILGLQQSAIKLIKYE